MAILRLMERKWLEWLRRKHNAEWHSMLRFKNYGLAYSLHNILKKSHQQLAHT